MPSCTAPHRPLASTPHVLCTIHPSVHFSNPPLLPLPAPAAHCLPTRLRPPPIPSPPTCSCSHLPWRTVPSPWSRGPLSPFLVSCKISTLPGALSRLTHSGSSCPQDPHSPPPPGAPSVPAVSAAAAFHLCTFLFPCGPFSGRNGTFLHGSSRESRRERARAQPGDRRERGGQGVVGARGLGEQGAVKCVGGRGLGQGGMEIGG